MNYDPVMTWDFPFQHERKWQGTGGSRRMEYGSIMMAMNTPSRLIGMIRIQALNIDCMPISRTSIEQASVIIVSDNIIIAYTR